MSVSADFSIDADKLKRDGDAVVRRYLSAGTRTIATVSRNLEQRLEAATQSAVPGKLWRAWQSSTYPEKGPAQNPVATIWLKGGRRTRGAVAFWTQPGEIRGKSGQYLAVPLPAAGPRGRSRDLTPGEWERANGIKLTFIYRAGRPSILAAVGGTTNARTGAFRPLTGGKRGRTAQGRGGANPQRDAVVPIFALLPLVKFRNAFAIAPMVDATEGEMAQAFLAAVSALN